MQITFHLLDFTCSPVLRLHRHRHRSCLFVAVVMTLALLTYTHSYEHYTQRSLRNNSNILRTVFGVYWRTWTKTFQCCTRHTPRSRTLLNSMPVHVAHGNRSIPQCINTHRLCKPQNKWFFKFVEHNVQGGRNILKIMQIMCNFPTTIFMCRNFDQLSTVPVVGSVS